MQTRYANIEFGISMARIAKKNFYGIKFADGWRSRRGLRPPAPLPARICSFADPPGLGGEDLRPLKWDPDPHYPCPTPVTQRDVIAASQLA